MTILLIKAAPTLLSFLFGVAVVQMPMAAHPGVHARAHELGPARAVPMDVAPVPVPAPAIAPEKEDVPVEPAREQE